MDAYADKWTADTKAFVEEVFAKYGSKPAPQTQLPPRPPPSATGFSIAKSNAFTSGQAGHGRNGPIDVGSRLLKAGRKRSFDEQVGRRFEPYHQATDRSTRTQKSRRRDRKERKLNPQVTSFQPTMHFQQGPPVASPQIFPPGFPMFDPNDPIAAMMAMQAFMQTFGMPAIGQRCREYDTKGFCARGVACPFQHGDDNFSAPPGPEHDPADALTDLQKLSGISNQARRSQKGKRSGSSVPPKGPHRNNFSDPNPNYDKSVTTIVVERIPEQNLEEPQIRKFFSQYGKVEEITIQPHKYLALVKFDVYAAARRAYESPKVVFDNRFVKVYWYKPELGEKETSKTTPPQSFKNGNGDSDAMDIDLETFARQQEAAQRAFEERMAKIQANQEAYQKLQEQQRQLQARHQTEKKELLARIAAAEARRSGSRGRDGGGTPESNTELSDLKSLEKERVQKALREQLALLEAEAKSLGIDPDAPPTPPHHPSHISPSYTRGRGGYRWGHAYYRGGYGESHQAFRQHKSGSVLRLDNRPKRVAISLLNDDVFDAAKDEALRQYLFSIGEFEGIEHDPDHPEGQTMIVTYAERYQAESLVAKGNDIPGIGKVEMKWYAGRHPSREAPVDLSMSGDDTRTSRPKEGADEDDEHMSEAEDLKMEQNTNGHDAHPPAAHAEVNYDVASDDEFT